MLGTACFRAQVSSRHAASISFCRSFRQHTHTNDAECSLQGVSSIRRPCCHSSSCVEERSEVSCATIWHGLLPSHHPSILDQGIISPLKNVSSFDPRFRASYSGTTSVVPHKDEESSRRCGSVSGLLPSNRKRYASGLNFPDASMIGIGRFAMASGLLDGSWNVAWDIRPARWLHGRHSAWLLFGVCACFSAAAGLSVPNLPLQLNPLMHVSGAEEDSDRATAKDFMQEKQVFTDYTVTGIPGDGRCLFRAIAYGACLRKGDLAPSESSQRELADELREKVVDELVSRRADCEWFIEEDFDIYARRMRECYVWGGEPELLMASHVLRMPIIVHLLDRSSGGIKSIAEYGLEYGGENPIRVLYHGFGHYDAVQVPGIGTPSKL